jgi:hypothetical protein
MFDRDNEVIVGAYLTARTAAKTISLVREIMVAPMSNAAIDCALLNFHDATKKCGLAHPDTGSLGGCHTHVIKPVAPIHLNDRQRRI